MRRHVFSQWELELLLDLQMCRLRKSARAGLLRRYLKSVQQQFSKGATVPPRLSAFLAREQEEKKPSAMPVPLQEISRNCLAAGLSSR